MNLSQRLNGPRKINQRKTATAKIKVRRAINFQVRLGMFPPAMSLYGITAASKAITLLYRAAIAVMMLKA